MNCVRCNVACIGMIGSLESDQCKSSQNGSSEPNWCFQIIVTKEWDFYSSAPTHSMVSSERRLSGLMPISDYHDILHSWLWSIQNSKSNSICLSSDLFNVWLSKSGVTISAMSPASCPRRPDESCHSDICQFEPLAYKLEIHTWPTSSL